MPLDLEGLQTALAPLVNALQKQREYKYSVGMGQNAKGEAQLEIKVRFDALPPSEDAIQKEIEKLGKQLQDACKTLNIKVAGQ